MKKYTVVKYSSLHYTIWNNFVSQAKNATFLFHRDFMEYHSNRFEDFSLLVLDEKENVCAVLPANRLENDVYSHQGLTYGGLILNKKAKLIEAISIFKQVLSFLNKSEIKRLEIKVIPSIYNDLPADELEYLAFLCEAKLIRRDILSSIDLQSPFKISQTRKNEITKSKQLGFEVKEVESFEDFWNQILIPNLEQKHQAKPVHTLEEITYLKEKFPKNIRQFNVYLNNEIVAGTTVFESNKVAHSQYISGNGNQQTNGSLDVLHHYLITEVFVTKKYFDFGISNENQGKKINKGLLFWKESFGARTVMQSFYQFETESFEKLNSVFI
ncbi:MAG: GNAT family N-acetyltransferase [Flavobacteriaceae bacterium]|nr:GNAT family N-acetyltransferase [Flavobacteriaceae bacterium]